jgi:hypothetical protein
MSKKYAMLAAFISMALVLGGAAVSQALPVEQLLTAASVVPATTYAAGSFVMGLAGVARLGRKRT